jgi:acetyl-CoA carboxylase biotin carboxyl carrier protein
MAEGDSGNPFDLEQLRQLVELMDEHGLTEVSLKKGSEHWRLRRGGQESPMSMYAPAAMMHPASAPPQTAAQQPAPAATPAPSSAAAENLVEIKSPTVGTFYASPSPDEPAFVSVGSKVTPTTIVCLIEAMKVFNQIPADVAGTITEVLVKNNDAVEYGQPLFKVRL